MLAVAAFATFMTLAITQNQSKMIVVHEVTLVYYSLSSYGSYLLKS